MCYCLCAAVTVVALQHRRVRLDRPAAVLHAVSVRLQLAQRSLSEWIHETADHAAQTGETWNSYTRRLRSLLPAGPQSLPGLPSPLLPEKDVR